MATEFPGADVRLFCEYYGGIPGGFDFDSLVNSSAKRSEDKQSNG